jgi:hypothetical protein
MRRGEQLSWRARPSSDRSARDGREARLREAIESGSVIEKPPSSSQARFALDDAAAELEIARKVLATSTASLGFVLDAQRWAERKVEACVAPILAAEVDRVLVETTRLSDELHGKHEVLIWLRSQLPPGGDERMRINSILPPPAPPGVRETDYRTPEDWVAAREALSKNADAPFPA